MKRTIYGRYGILFERHLMFEKHMTIMVYIDQFTNLTRVIWEPFYCFQKSFTHCRAKSANYHMVTQLTQGFLGLINHVPEIQKII